MILVTGSSGFVGSALCDALHTRGMPFIGAVRKHGSHGHAVVGDIHGSTDWAHVLPGCDVVIHLAARVHVMADVDPNPLNAYRQSNVEGTLNLAKQAAHSGVKRFVFVSSVKVNGEGTLSEPFRPSDTPMPSDPYGHSKWEAECGLAEIGRATGMEIVVIRPPLVYGPGVKANFLNLMKLVRSGIPLPFGRASGRRSLVALDNLVDVLILCTHHPAAADRTFLVSDGNDLTIGELATEMAIAMRMKPRLLPVPVALITTLAKLVGRSSVASRLFGSLQVDISDTKQVLGWMPNITPRCAIEKTVLEFLRMEGKV